MEELEKIIVNLISEEHQDWIKHIKEAEEKGIGIDLNLGGGFAVRLEKVLEALRNFRGRYKKRGLFSK